MKVFSFAYLGFWLQLAMIEALVLHKKPLLDIKPFRTTTRYDEPEQSLVAREVPEPVLHKKPLLDIKPFRTTTRYDEPEQTLVAREVPEPVLHKKPLLDIKPFRTTTRYDEPEQSLVAREVPEPVLHKKPLLDIKPFRTTTRYDEPEQTLVAREVPEPVLHKNPLLDIKPFRTTTRYDEPEQTLVTRDVPEPAMAAGFGIIEFPKSVKELKPPHWLSSWEDAEFVANLDQFQAPFGSGNKNVTLQAAYWLASMTGGVWLNNPVFEKQLKKEDFVLLDDMVIAYAEDGDVTKILALQNLTNGVTAKGDNVVIGGDEVTGYKEVAGDKELSKEKRAGPCFFRNGWTRSSKHVAKAAALASLTDTISESCNWLVSGRPAICGKTDDGVTACIAWDGEWQAMRGCVIKAVLESAIDEFGGKEDISAYCPGCLHSGKYKTWNGKAEQACVSNKAYGCSRYLEKRFDWDNVNYGWCLDSP